jgi:hypothetical protein
MKKLALTIVCALAVTGVAFGQANLVTFTPVHGDITFQTNSVSYSPLFGGGASGLGVQANIGVTAQSGVGLIYDFTLLYQTQSGYQVLATDKSVWDGTWKDTGLTATNASNFNGAVNNAVPTANSVPWATGVTNSIVMVGWSANLGNTWASVSNILAQLSLGNSAPLAAQLSGQLGFFGESTFGYITPATSPSPGAALFGTGAATGNGQPIFSLLTPLYVLPVPEPATMALAGLGGLSMLLFRRQRK